MSDSEDPACVAALAAAIGHDAPFSDEELSRVRSLTITHARDVSPIAGCTGLEHLRIVASELDDLLALEDVESVAHLEIHATRLGRILGLLPSKLRRIDVLFSSMHDGMALLGAPPGWQGTLVGCPWDKSSRRALGQQLDAGHIAADLGARGDWEECRLLWERLGACSGEIAGDYGLIVRPGIPALTKNTYDAIRVPTGVASNELHASDVSLAKLFSTFADRIEAPDLSELAATRTFGRSGQAVEWIASSALAPADKSALSTFVSRFPDVVFYRVTKAANDRKEKAFTQRLPDGYRAMRETIDGWFPQGMCPPVRFDAFEQPSPRQDRIGHYTYFLGLRDHGEDQRDAMLTAGFIIVGWSKESPVSALAIRLDGDPAVYEYSPEDIMDAISEGRSVNTSTYPVFRSYAAMLGHVASIHTRDRVIAAKGSASG